MCYEFIHVAAHFNLTADHSCFWLQWSSYQTSSTRSTCLYDEMCLQWYLYLCNISTVNCLSHWMCFAVAFSVCCVFRNKDANTSHGDISFCKIRRNWLMMRVPLSNEVFVIKGMTVWYKSWICVCLQTLLIRHTHTWPYVTDHLIFEVSRKCYKAFTERAFKNKYARDI